MSKITKYVYETFAHYKDEEGRFHREDGPAEEYSDGTKFWYFHGKLHREDGPAVEYPDLSGNYFLNGEFYKKEAYEKALKVLLLKRKLGL